MIVSALRRTVLGVDPAQRKWAEARIRDIDRRLTALLTAREANNAQRVVRATGRGKR